MPSGHVIELTIRCGNPMYNPRRADSMPFIPAPGQHIPDGYPKLTDDRSVTRNALPATSAEEAEVLEPGGASAPVDAESNPDECRHQESNDSDNDDELSGIHPHLLRDMAN
jgi:hypothetical protein